MQDGQYSISYNNQITTSQDDCNNVVESSYIISVKSSENGSLNVSFMQGFDSFLAACICHENNRVGTEISKEDIFDFIIFNDPDYGMYLSQESMPDNRLIMALDRVAAYGEHTSEEVFQLLQTQMIRDISIIALKELDEIKNNAQMTPVVGQNKTRLAKSEQGEAGCKLSILELKKIIGEQPKGDYEALLSDAWEAVHNQKCYQNTGIQYVCYELDKSDSLAYHESVYHSYTLKQHKHIIRRIVRID
ncbi:hypothetical protein [Pseudoalteromonas luteoviolacea]|uniref:Uncharacterized protein n=1 Tax=Pseudoalteromonas luteoviolacea S4054 TaxID=1129367 RepID=A0A0F6A8R1_9GAMM|nr:hypothetical protein [Pseudoalteromonas luteoviolacea]AOT11128.1 hypothetical protein S4054249_25175 [Pseudoalteromonas luteoviolacea]AOT15708.1 hypothetical protein S40542_23335 [Pseudoalteromonas luteoviolacea]AOT20949.1 hypothetical protein S4054_25095 [Pseudoalteromonas luteoviolacea]KKE82231.1 hypothetical protein N479_19225 [Pseudoalteromonas luteoviolacea S4054]KZN65436.1 hypothetical protein N481_25105 [Pseudoalteromonas luteoviolacea S4047-1]